MASDPDTGFVGGMQDVFGGEIKYAQLYVSASHEADAQVTR
jgi:hypothetical protein